MPSIKRYNKKNNKWEIKSTSDAINLGIMDIEGNFESDNVEGALRELSGIKDNVNVNSQSINSIKNTINEHLTNHPSGGSGTGGSMPTIESDWELTTVDGDLDFTIPIYYTSPNLGEGTCYVLINNVETSIQSVNQGNNEIRISALGSGTKKIVIYVKDRAGLLSNKLTWNVVCGGIKLTVTMNTNIDYKVTDRILLTYNIECDLNEKIETHIKIDSVDYTVESNKGYNSYEIKGLSVGIHKIEIYSQSDIYITPTQVFNVIIVATDSLYVTSSFDTTKQYEKGNPINIDYRISIADTLYYTVNLYLDDLENPKKVLNSQAGGYYWTITDNLELGEHTVRIEAYNSDKSKYHSLDLTFTLVASSYTPIEYVKGGLLAWFDAKGRTNSDVDRNYWIDKINGYIGRLYNSNYGTNGWIDDTLVMDGNTYMEIDMKPFENNVTTGITIDMVFKTKDIGNTLARVFDCTSASAPYAGAYITPYKTYLSTIGHNTEVDIGEDEFIQVTLMIDRVNKFGKVFINGVCCDPFILSDSTSGNQIIYESIQHNEKIYLNSEKGTSNFGECSFKRLMIYERELSDDEILQNRIADMSLDKQEEEYNKNYNDSYMPAMYVYGDVENMNLTNKKEVRVKYVSPNADLYGSSFDFPYCKMYWQGTSSIQYANKNYNLEFYDNNRNAVFYTPFKTGVPENLICLKCNQMESSNAMNTGSATYVNDNLYTKPNPAQEKNPKIRQAIDGFPILLYINDTFVGLYDFNLDRYSYRSFGYNLFDKCLCYEVSANSDTTAGAFNSWTQSSGKTEQEYYSADFQVIYPPSRQNGNDDFKELKNLIDFVSNADEDTFKANFDTYFDRESVFRYYLFTQVFGCVDSLGKNMKLVTFDGVKWYLQVYDIDTAIGLDNSGALRYDTDIEVESGIFNTSNSKLWQKLRLYYDAELKQEYINMRNDAFNLDNMLKYFYDNQIDKIPVRYYNKSTQFKYLNYGSQYLYACHGNRYYQIKRWLKERLLYCDTLFGYTPTTSDYITIRCNKLGSVYLNIETYSPMYLSVKWENTQDGSGIQTLKVERNKSTKFSWNIKTETDQEVLIYGAKHIKSLGDLSNCNPTHLLLSNAKRINEVVCKNSSKLVNAQIDGCNYLQTINFNGCNNLGTLTGYQVLELSNCTNLKYLDIRGTKMTGVNFNNNGGNLVEIYLPRTIQSLYLRNQYSLKVVGLTYANYVGAHWTESKSGATDITSFTLINCPLVERLTASTYYNINRDFYDFNGNLRKASTLGDYEDANKMIELMRFGTGLCNATSIHIENSMLSCKNMGFIMNYRLENLTLRYLPNLEELIIGYTDSGNVWNNNDYLEGSFNYDNIETLECPNLKTFRIHQYTDRDCRWFNSLIDTIDLTKFENLETFTCNITTQNLSTIILPSTLKTFWIKGVGWYSTTNYVHNLYKNLCNIQNIYFKEDHPDGYEGVDFGNRLLNNVCLYKTPKVKSVIGLNTKNTYVNPIFNHLEDKDESEDYPFIKPQGKIDLSEYDWTNAYYWFANIDFTNDDIEYVMPNDWDYLIDNRLTRVQGLFYNCTNPNFTWDFASRFFKLLNNRDDLARTYRLATLAEQTSYEGSGVTLENNYNISDYNYGATPFYGTNLKYIKECTFAGNAIGHNVFRNSGLIKVGTVNFTGDYTWWTSENLFANSSLLEEVECINMPNSTTSIGWFSNCPKLKRVGSLNIDSTNCSSLYLNCYELESYALPSMSKCKDISNEFNGCYKLTNISLPDLTEDTPLEKMNGTFANCKELVSISMGGEVLPTTLVGMDSTYYNSPKLTNLYPLPIDFDNKCTMNKCCRSCHALTDETIYKVIPYNCSNLNEIYMECDGLINPIVVVNADRADAQRVFKNNATNLLSANIEFNGTYMYGLNEIFMGCSHMTDVHLKFPYSVYFNEESQCSRECHNIFAYCNRLVNVDLDMSFLETKCCFGYMFRQDKYIESIKGFDLSNLHRNDQAPNDYGWYFTNDTSFEFIKDWIFAIDENGETKKITSSYKIPNLELVPLATLGSLINGLGTVENETLTLGNAVINRLTDEQKTSATSKGWTLV